MFPNAKFIYLRRNPVEVIPSTIRMLKSMINLNTLQTFEDTQLTKQVNLMHTTVLAEFEKQRKFINQNNLLEIDYVEFITAPLATIRKIYIAFELGGFETSVRDFQHFIEEQKDYKPHTYSPILDK